RWRAERILVGVEPPVGAARGLGDGSRIAALDGAHRIGSAGDRGLGDVGGMRIADRVVLDGAQPEPLRSVVGGLLQPPVVEYQDLRLAVLEVELAVIRALEAAGDDLVDVSTIEP